MKYTEFLPQYYLYAKAAPLKRNLQIIKYADMVLVFWDRKSKGTLNVINKCKELNIPIRLVIKLGNLDPKYGPFPTDFS